MLVVCVLPLQIFTGPILILSNFCSSIIDIKLGKSEMLNVSPFFSGEWSHVLSKEEPKTKIDLDLEIKLVESFIIP